MISERLEIDSPAEVCEFFVDTLQSHSERLVALSERSLRSWFCGTKCRMKVGCAAISENSSAESASSLTVHSKSECNVLQAVTVLRL